MSAEKTASIVWKGANMDFHARLDAGYEFEMSGPPNSSGGSPMEFMLAAAAGCTAMDVISILSKKRQKLQDFVVEITGQQAEEPPNVYTEATILFILRGESIDPEAVERAIELSQSKYCSASIMFKRAGCKVTTEYRIEEVQRA